MKIPPMKKGIPPWEMPWIFVPQANKIWVKPF
jgi:hypothetical protein